MALPSIGGKNPAYYLVFFLLGCAATAHPAFREEIERRAPLALFVAILCAPALVGWLWPLGSRVAPFTWQATGVGLVMSLSTWSWIVALAGFASAHLRRGGRALEYLTQVSYPFYLLHLPILTIVALAAVQTTAGVWMKFIGINLLTIPATFLACELLVRRTRLTRFLFGLKPARGTD
jgi:peptidoglycan/LPS O-acetylase OafA/YrhL